MWTGPVTAGRKCRPWPRQAGMAVSRRARAAGTARGAAAQAAG